MTTSRSRVRVALSHLAYDALVGLAVLAAAPPLLVRGLRDGRHGRWARERLLGRLPEGAPSGRPVWIHAVSVGEVKAARPLVELLRARAPELPLVVTTGTVTGLETARRLYPALYVCHAPLDVAVVVRRVVRRLDPRLLVLLELEAWPALMRAVDVRGAPVVVVNGRITEKSFSSYRRIRWWLPEFDRLALVAAQDELQRERFIGLGVPPERVVVAGNLKHDLGAPAPPAAVAALRAALGLPAVDAPDAPAPPVFVAGSTHAGEEEAAVAAWRAAGGPGRCRLLLVPRHVERVESIERALRRLGVGWRRRSAPGGPPRPDEVVLFDTMGELEACFGLADVVFLGGSLAPVGGHNVLEPAWAGVPVLVGPHLETARREADLLADAGGLLVVRDTAALGRVLRELLDDAARRRAMGERARQAATGLRGAAGTTLALLLEKGLLSLDAASE